MSLSLYKSYFLFVQKYFIWKNTLTVANYQLIMVSKNLKTKRLVKRQFDIFELIQCIKPGEIRFAVIIMNFTG